MSANVTIASSPLPARSNGPLGCMLLRVPELRAELLDLRRHLVDVVARHAHAADRAGLERKRLRRPRLIVGHVAAVDGPFFDPVDRLAGDAVEDVHEVHLARLKHGRNRRGRSAATSTRSGGVGMSVVPHVVMHELVVPLQLAGVAVEREDRVAVEVHAGHGAIRVARRRQTRCPVDLVGGQVRPDVAAASILPGVAGPVLVVRLTGPAESCETTRPACR